MDVYETMWKELVQRVILANQYSIRKDLTLIDVINLLKAYEEHFKTELDALQDEEIKEELGLEPVE